ncbi:MAG: nucleotidyl transferase AbiEii/AbiGii toxin family protein [Ignavibacteriales bacterium]|nr:nucleotidyl transferase AbiEii/AbiGii toxin family protein [Ignavibacteriales bacterium]
MLVGGTAIALYLGHRYSIDFDLFTLESYQKKKH